MAVDMNQILTQQVQQEVAKAAPALMQPILDRMAALEAQGGQATSADLTALQGDVAKLRAQLATAADAAAASVVAVAPQLGTTLLTTARGIGAEAIHDPWIPRMAVAILGAAILVLLIGCEANSHWALDTVGALVPLAGTLAAIVGRMVLTSATGIKPAPQANPA